MKTPNPDDPIPGFLRLKEAAEAEGITPQTMAALCRRGRIPGALRIGREWILPEGWERAKPKPAGRPKTTE